MCFFVLECLYDIFLSWQLQVGPFGASLRRGLMIGLHGGASESLRDNALQLIAVAFQGLGGRWAIEGEASTTPKGCLS